ncbi:MAG: aminotransferase class I/II-fold pyridoxal phosphate-dependent enzyme [Clostridia bacterium]|nr:aminotransferase class I/II-fold pyridoxal phosphate-dependent enzyme [Clostridia bacterium]
MAALENREYFRPQLEAIIAGRQWLSEELIGIESVEVFPSKANFILFRVPGCAGEVFRRLAEEGVFIRYFNEAPGLEKCLRISVGKKEDNSAFVEKIRNILGQLSAVSYQLKNRRERKR